MTEYMPPRSISAAFLFAFVVTGAIIGGCAPAPDTAAVVATAPPAVLPEFERVLVPGLELQPQMQGMSTVTVSPGGHIAFMPGRQSPDVAFTIVDTLGNAKHAGRIGTGRGEVGSMAIAFFAGARNDLHVLDVAGRRVVIFGVDGRHRRTTDAFEAGYPLTVFADSIDMMLFDDYATPASIVRMSLRTLQRRTLVDDTDSTFAAIRGAAPMAANSRALVVGWTVAYRFQSYDRDGHPLSSWGRDIPPPSDMSQRTRQFNNIVFDGAGRLWAIGPDENALTFADVFADTTFLGRISLPCKSAGYAPAFNAEWMALPCVSPQDSSRVELQLFRAVK